MSWKDYNKHRYKFGRLGDLVERIPKGQQQSEDDTLPGYGSDTGSSSKVGPARGLPRGSRGVPRGPRGPRGPRPPRPPPKKPKKIAPKKKPKKISSKALEAEARMKAAFDQAEQEATDVDEKQLKEWENAEKMVVETRLCPRTKRQVRVDMWDAHVSALSAKITDYMYLGGERNAHNHKELTYRTHVGFVLNAAWEVGNFYPQEIEYLKLPFQDFKDQAGALAKDLNKSADFIDRARAYNSSVLVHCVAGISRSSSICIHYLVRREGWTLKKAYHHVLKLRPIIRPNIGFFRELQRVEREMLGYNTMSIEEWKKLEDGSIKIAAFS